MNVVNFFKFIESKRPHYSLESLLPEWKVRGVIYPYNGKGTWNINGEKEGQFEKYSYFFPENEQANDAFDRALKTGENLFLSEVINYKRGELNGQCTTYYSNGQVKEIGNFQYGNRYGVHKAYYPDGKLDREILYDNGIKNGYEKHYTKNGKLRGSTEWALGRKHGQEKVWTDDGSVLIEVNNYVDGRREGPSFEFYSNGHPQRQATFKDDYIIGDFKKFHSNGVIAVHEYYDENIDEDIPKFSIKYDWNGIKQEETIYTNTHKILRKYKDGEITHEENTPRMKRKPYGSFR